MTYVNALSVGQRGTRRIHASPSPPEPWGDRYLALCGTIVVDVTTVEFDPAGAGDVCPPCAGMLAG